MGNRDSTISKIASQFGRLKGAFILLLNIVLLWSAFFMYARYVSVYRDRLREENLGNIANMNRSASANASAMINSWNIKLNDIAQYVKTHDMSYSEALDMISESNSSDERYFELIGSDYTGHLARRAPDGGYPPLSYKSSSYAALQRVFDEVEDDTGDMRFAPEFTDNGETALKFFAMYRHIPLRDENGDIKSYTLLLAAKSKYVLSLLNAQVDYEGQSTVMIDPRGDYIIGNRDFKSTNFFQYLYVYNDLTLDEKNAVQRRLEEQPGGELYYKNAGAVIEDCVFRYERMEQNGWYCVTCVPISSFRAPAFNTGYIVYAVVMLSALFLVDIAWMHGMNIRLRASMLREKEAGAAKGNFMSRMSHEIRTPLNAVIGYNVIARNELSTAKDDEQRRHIEMKVMDCLTKSDIASKHLLTIINDVLDMSAIESGKIKVAHDRFDFKNLITSLTTVFYTQARSKDVDFEVKFDTLTEEWFMGDQMRTNQILTNLLSNAVKFTPEGGSVKLTIYQPEADVNAAHIHFEVADTGIGMTEEYLGHIWTPFEQADSTISRRFGGTGLGLSITKNLVDIMGGSISVESSPGHGTVFGVDLTFERTQQPQKNEIYDFSGINALVVDDDESTCDYIRLLFERCEARCTTVTSGAAAIEAMAAAKERNDGFTLCLVDWRMPGMDGIETVKRVREISGDDTPFIILTAYDYSEIVDSAAEARVDRFISKPLFQSSLFDMLANIGGNAPHKRLDKSRSFDFSGARILIAEDNVMNMEISKRIMESAGLTVDSAWNGREALEMFEASKQGTYMAVLMDVHMPEMDGHEATRAIRASSHPEAASIPIIAMTADAFAENVAEAHAAGMNEHISKPIDIGVLFDVLAKYMPNKI